MTDIQYHRIAASFFNRPLLLSPLAAETISTFLLSRVRAGSRSEGENDSAKSTQYFPGQQGEGGSVTYHSPRASRFLADTPVGENGRPLPFRRTQDGSAIITVVGELVNRGAWIGASSGLVSYEAIKYQLSQAAIDPKTKAIVLDLETPGGEAVGAFEVAATVRAAAQVKPVVAVVNGMAASAGYAIASGATRIVTMPTGVSGSIGVVMAHLDYSQYLAEEGVKPTLIFAGAHKVDGNPFEALPEAVRADFQREVDAFYAKFVGAVATGRRGLSAEAIRSTEARTYLGEEAVRVGLADSVGTLESVLDELSRTSSGSLQSQISKTRSMKMSENGNAPGESAGVLYVDATTQAARPGPIQTSAALCAAYPALTFEIAANAAAAERERILGIEDIAVAGHEAMVDGMKRDGKTTPEQAAASILRAEKQTRGKAMTAIRNVETETGGVAAAPPPGEKPAEKTAGPLTRDELIANYEHDAKLRAEFPSAAVYVSYMQAEQSGKVRRLTGRAKG